MLEWVGWTQGDREMHVDQNKTDFQFEEEACHF